jgi:lipase maturation factor 1
MKSTPAKDNHENFERQFKSNKEEDEIDDTASPTFYVTRWAIFRSLGFCYFVAFVAAWNQNLALMGQNGLLPAGPYWDHIQQQYNVQTPLEGFLQQPSLFWWIPLNDRTLEGIAVAGVFISALIVTGVYVSWISWVLLWLLQFTLITTAQGTPFYQYGWESQLLETTVLAVFLCDLPRLDDYWKPNLALFPSHQSTPSSIILWLFRWLSFRISMGAGLIKRRGSSCWTDKTCLWYHFETQPIPSPLSFIFHFLPKSILSRAVDLDMMVQFYTSPMVLLAGKGRIPRTILRVAGLIQTGFMVNIMLSGNFSFLNHLTIVPALACFDDACFPEWLQNWIVPSAYAEGEYAERFQVNRSFPPRWMVDCSLLALIGYLSTPVVNNLLQLNGSQVMNGTFDTFRLVNTYGAFGSVGKHRMEPIITVSTDGENWKELDLPCKPGTVTRRPCFCAPYHYRLDWNIWFIGFPPHQAMLQRRERWLYALLENVLSQQEGPWMDLLDPSAVEYLKATRVRFARVDMYHYEMAAPLWEILRKYLEGRELVQWWNRTRREPLLETLAWNAEERLYWVK